MRLRLFVGIPLPAVTVAALQTAARIVRQEDPSWSREKWVDPENLHLTLAFLGDVDESVLPALISVIGEVVSFAAPVTLSPLSISAMPNRRNCRMLWASFEDTDFGAAALADSIRLSTAPYCATSDDKQFRAHATLCRARRSHSMDEAALTAAEQAFLSRAESVSDPAITLYSSRLTPRGPHYSEIATWHTVGECD